MGQSLNEEHTQAWLGSTEFACNDSLRGYTSCLRPPGQGLAAASIVSLAPSGLMLMAFPGQNNEAQSPAPRESPADELSRMRALRQALEMLPKGKIYLDAPIEMKVGDRRSVDARVGYTSLDRRSMPPVTAGSHGRRCGGRHPRYLCDSLPRP